MKRRQLIKYIAQAGLFSSSGFSVNSRFFAAPNLSISGQYDGPLWIIINAQGGWDVTSLCDPKGYNSALDKNNPDRINNYDSADIQQAGNLFYAPPPNSFKVGQGFYNPDLYTSKIFFEKYFQQLLVINGIDCKTNSHANGQLYNLSGRLMSGYPAFSALVSAARAPDRPLSYLTYGGYSHSAGLITPVKMNNSSLRAIFEIAYANRSSIPNSINSRLYLPAEVEALITNTSNERHQALLAAQNLPRIRKSLGELIHSRKELTALKGLADNLEQTPPRSEADFNGRDKAYRLYQQGRMALAGYQQGVTASVNIRLNGFDTHSNHDEKHYPLLMDLLQGIDAIIDEAKNRNLQDQIVLVVVSDFGRTNKYNKENGKDHWPINSAMVIGNRSQQVRGNRVIGMTSAGHKAYNIDPVSLNPDTVGNNSQSVSLTPAHLHLSLRRLAAIDNAPAAVEYGLEGKTLALF